MVGTKMTCQRIENKMAGTKIARPRDGRHKNNSPKGWMGGELYGRHENNSITDMVTNLPWQQRK